MKTLAIKSVLVALVAVSCAALSACNAQSVERAFSAYSNGTLPQIDDQSWEAGYSDEALAPITWRTNPNDALRAYLANVGPHVEDALVAVDWFRDCTEDGGTIVPSDSCLEQANELWGLR